MGYEPPDRLLRVDLGNEAVESEEVPRRWLRRYLGGKGLGARYLYGELDPGTDPLGPKNAILFVMGPLSGVLPGEPRYAIVTRSPLTGTFLDSYSGGTFAGALVGALDEHVGLLVTGRAETPAAIVLRDGEVALRSAESLRGRETGETCRAFDYPVACIGPAGENRVRFASVASDGGDHHAGRGGAGAVMGAKRLKAVVARGERPDPPPELAALREEYAKRYRDDPVGEWRAASGTLETVDFANEVGVLPTRGWQERTFEAADDIGIEAAREAAIDRESEGSVPGGFRVETEAGSSVPRGATPMTLGAGLGIDGFDAVATLGDLCDRLGMDVISAGNAVAWVVRAGKEGLVDRDVSFGDEAGARAIIEEIAGRKTPLGDALADGVDAAAREYGGDDLIPTVKSMEVPSYDPRGSPATALAYATSDRGACHRRSLPVETEAFRGDEWTDADRVRLVIREQNAGSVLWSLVADDFAGSVLREDLGAEWLGAVGLPDDPARIRRIGERIWTLTRLFNVREGFDATDDSLPAVFTRPAGSDSPDGTIDPEWFEAIRRRYYAKRGWSERGVPSRSLLKRLDLEDVVDDATPVAPSAATPP